MREEDGAAPALTIHAGQDVLEEGVVGAPLRRRAQEVAPPRVALPRRPVPLLDRIGRVGQHNGKGAQPIPLGERGPFQRVPARDGKILHPMQHQIHARNRGGHVVALLPVQTQRAILAAVALHLVDGGDQHAGRAAGGVIDALARLRVEHLHHQMHDRAVGVELLRRVAAVVGKLL